jgi:NodT family efflux transporter outer membrane factor (OMF) lipoprotein
MRAGPLAASLALATLAACTVGPDYRRPALEMPAQWKIQAPWREATPRDHAPKGAWWSAFADADLDALEARALAGSATLAIAAARLDQARSTLDAALASRYPQLSLGLREQRTRTAENRPLSNYASPQFSTVQGDFVLGLNASYELDLAGRVRRSVEGARAGAEQSAADFENVRLVLTADVATAYFNVRALDIELDVLTRSIDLQRRALELATSRHELGAASGLDVAQQRALLDSTLTQVDVLRKQRAQFEHALATLVGTPAPVFALAADARRAVPPPIPVGVPSDVLERRPDVAAAERAMAAANAQVGVATAALYPSITLGASAGRESRDLAALFDAPSAIWSLGASLTQPLFDAGRLQANVRFARAGYEAAVASYRRTVLAAMQEVEDGITGLAALERAHAQAGAAVASAERLLEMANARYEGGASGYLEVITAQQFLLNNQRLQAQLQGQRLLTAVFLVKALGGGWTAHDGAAMPASAADEKKPGTSPG